MLLPGKEYHKMTTTSTVWLANLVLNLNYPFLPLLIARPRNLASLQMITLLSTVEADFRSTKERLQDQKAQHKSQCKVLWFQILSHEEQNSLLERKLHELSQTQSTRRNRVNELLQPNHRPILSPPPTLALPNQQTKHAQLGTPLLCTLPPRTPTTETLLPLHHNSSVSSGGQGKVAQWKMLALPISHRKI